MRFMRETERILDALSVGHTYKERIIILNGIKVSDKFLLGAIQLQQS